MSPADYQRAGATVKAELGHWRDFMGTLAPQPSGEFRPLDGPVKTSLRAYFAAPANTYAEFTARELGARGFDEWANVLNDGAHHCRSEGSRPSCRAVSGRGFVPVAERVPRGARGCHWNCLCGDLWRNSITGEVRE